MIVVSIDPSINPKNFGVCLFDTSIHQDPLKCLLPIESPEEYRKRLRFKDIKPKEDKNGFYRAKVITFWTLAVLGNLSNYYAGLGEGVILITEDITNKSVWAKDPVKKAGRGKSLTKTMRANDFAIAGALLQSIEVIEISPAKFKATKIERSQKLDMILGTDREPRNEHVDDAIHRGSLWITEQKFK